LGCFLADRQVFSENSDYARNESPLNQTNSIEEFTRHFSIVFLSVPFASRWLIMSRKSRADQFTPDEIAVVHVINRAVRGCFLMGFDQLSGKNFDYRKLWIEQRMEQMARYFGIDLLCNSILSNHLHLVLRSRPDVVATWDDTQVAWRWSMLCPKKKNKDGSPREPTEAHLNAIRNNPKKLRDIRSRLSDISWWMRLMCQTIAQRINREDACTGKVWEARFKATRLLDESALLACSAYVDLNPIRAAIAECLESSDFTSVQRRIQALKQLVEADCLGQVPPEAVPDAAPAENTLDKAPDRHLAPVFLDPLADAGQAMPSKGGYRCSDLGYLNMTLVEYLELLDWTARQRVQGKRGSTPEQAPGVFERLNLGFSAGTWCELVDNFGQLFGLVAGRPPTVDAHRAKGREGRFHLSDRTRQLLTNC
jgi:REP element-mobilizing transposase RayT